MLHRKSPEVSLSPPDDGSSGIVGMAGLLGCILAALLCFGPVHAANGDTGQPAPREEVKGVLWKGEAGISESVAEIMKREAALPSTSGPVSPRVIPFRRIPGREFLPQDPGSNPVSHTPAAGRAIASSGTRLYTPQTVGSINFTGATLADTNAFPPDSMGAIGPTQYIVAVNGRIRSFDKTTGLADGVLNTGTDAFFATVMTPTSPNFTSDPRIRYDRLSGRWFITMIDVPEGAATQPNRIMIAVSSGSTVTNSSNFTFFYFQHDQVGTTPNDDTGDFADYPTLGIDANALYIGVNVFNSSGIFVNTTAFVVQKSSILGVGPIGVTAFRSLIGTDGPDTPQGVDNYDPAATAGYFIGVSDASLGRLILRRVTDPGTTSPSLSGNIVITVPDTYPPLLVPHKGSTGGRNGYLDALDDRLFAAHLRDGSLWTAHNLAVDGTGVAGILGDRDGSRWYEITGLDTTPILHQSGTVFDPSATNPLFYWIPTIMVSGQGHAALGFSVAGANHYADAGTVGRLAGDTLGTTETPLLYTSSSTAYNPIFDHGGPYGRRWGDYSYTSLDPDDDMTMWTIQEFCNNTNSYGVQVVKLLAPPPATPVSASPSTVDTGLSSVDVVITGTSVAGSGFFDPGPDFPDHIDVSIPGVTINSVTYNDPTHVTVNISTVGSSAGSVAVTVTNPDGQSSSSASAILTVTHPCSAITVNPATLTDATYGSPYSQTFTASGGTSPYTFGLTGPIPTGMTFSTDTLSGTPSQAGSFSFTIAAMDSYGCSGSRSYTLNVVNSTAVRIESSPDVYYQTIQSAYDHPVVDGDVIQMQAIDFLESPTFANAVSFTLSGGYDPSFDTPPSSYTSVMGTLTITAGTVTIENLILH